MSARRQADLDAELGPLQRRLVLPVAGGFYALLDLLGFQFWAFPLRVIGMNSIAAYCMAELFEDFIAKPQTHLGQDAFEILG